MPNHFHLLIKVRGSDELEGFLQAKKQRIKTLFIPKEHTQEKLYNFIVGRQFHNFLGGYSKAFNKFHNRKGSLMRQNTRRKIVDDENYLVNAIMYIHLNPVLHGFTSHPEEWPFSSYHAFLNDSKTKIPRKLILDWFGSDKRNFIDLHENKLKDSLNPDWET